MTGEAYSAARAAAGSGGWPSAAAIQSTPDSKEKRVRTTISQLSGLLNHDKYFWVDELDGVAKNYPYRHVLDIFVRVNSGGTKLTAGDLMFAAMNRYSMYTIERSAACAADASNPNSRTSDKTRGIDPP